MRRVNAILRHPLFAETLRLLDELEAERAFCRHDLTHLLDVARLMWIDVLEKGLDLDRETVYAAAIAAAFPTIPFPDGWKANLPGTDLNLQYPALWDEAREVKFAQGFDRPAPRDYVGAAPLSARESRAVYELTERLDPALLMAFHTQGEVIYWKFQDREPPGSRELAVLFSAVSGYALEDVPYASSFAGLKDWFILRSDRPGFTVEAGRGQNPLPLTELGEMIRRCTPMMTLAALGEVGTA